MAESGARLRTRRAILDAAVTALAGNPAATLADIAVVANVGRTTVHRYFPERSDLIRAISLDFLEKVEAATEAARLDDGPVPEALRRLCQEYFEFGELFTLPELVDVPEADRSVLRLVERGHREGTVDPDLEPAWVLRLVQTLLATTWSYARDTDTPKHQALTLCLHTLTKSLTP